MTLVQSTHRGKKTNLLAGLQRLALSPYAVLFDVVDRPHTSVAPKQPLLMGSVRGVHARKHLTFW